MAPSTQYKGIVVPTLTIFSKEYQIDHSAQELLIRHVIKNEADVLFLLGSTGEGQFIQKRIPRERRVVLTATRDALIKEGKPIPVIVGIFGNTPEEVREQYHLLNEMQAHIRDDELISGYVLSPPLDIKLSDDDLLEYLDKITAVISNIPVFIYNNPSRFGGNMIPLDVYEKLLEKHENIVGIKDSTKDLTYKGKIIDLIRNYKEKCFYTGSEGDYFQCLELAAEDAKDKVGCIPSISNVLSLPQEIKNAYLAGNQAKAQQIQDDLNAIRNRIYHAPKYPGKAQRGGKLALAMLYPDSSLDRDVIVEPAYKKAITKEDRASIRLALDEAIENNYILDRVD